MFSAVAILVALAVVALLVFAATRPDTFHVERHTSIKAKPEKIFPLINDFRRWASWSPYETLDSGMKRTYTGAASGKGSVYHWDGHGKAGAGKMEIVDAEPPSRITIKLEFTRPFAGRNQAEFTLEPGGNSTKLTWAVYGASSYMSKVLGLFLSMDSLLGKDFETGLANLKTLAEQ